MFSFVLSEMLDSFEGLAPKLMEVELTIKPEDFVLVGGQIALKSGDASVQVYQDAWYTYVLSVYPESAPYERDFRIEVERFDETGNVDERGCWLRFDRTWLGHDRPVLSEVTRVLQNLKSDIQEEHKFFLNKDIETTHYQTWQVVALLRGLGFVHNRTEDGDIFRSAFGTVSRIRSSWAPREEGKNKGGYYIDVFSFMSPEGHEDVIVWYSNSGGSSQLFWPVAVSSMADWVKLAEDISAQAWGAYLSKNSVR